MEIALPDDGVLAVEPSAEGCALAPWPLAVDAAEILVPVRVVPLTGYANDADVASTILATPVEQRAYRLAPG